METYDEWYAKNKTRIEAEKKALNLELDNLINQFPIKELEKRFFKDFGCINFKTAEFMHELKLARAFHDFHKQLCPNRHNEREYDKWRCYHVTECKCGLSESCDSSD